MSAERNDRGGPAAGPIYGINDRPSRLWESLLYAWQHTLVDISPFVLPLAVAGALGMSAHDRAAFINFCLFSMGLATLIQTTIGNRLPIIQGPSATLTGTLAPVAAQLGPGAMWGGIFVGGLIEVALGASRLLGTLRRLFPPLVSGVVIVSIGFALGQVAVRVTIGDGRIENFLFSGGVIALIFVLQVAFRNRLGGLLARGSVFLSIWAVGLGVGQVSQRVDWELVAAKPWFQMPGLFPYGGPGFGWELSMVAILAVLAGYLGSVVESIGDYAATCQVSGERFGVRHMNRGILAEGLGCLTASIFGGLPCTSYTQNIGIIATTGVASRYVVRIAAVILMLYGLCPKFGALLVAIPRSVLGGVFIVVCGTIVISGVRLLNSVDWTPGSTLLAGTTLIAALGLPIQASGSAWITRVPTSIGLLLTNSVVISVILAVCLNLIVNVIPGLWRTSATGSHAGDASKH